MYDNKKSVDGIHYTRYIASWMRTVTNSSTYRDFEHWLISLGLPQDDINNILEIARGGKMELEHSAENFVINLNKPDYKSDGEERVDAVFHLDDGNTLAFNGLDKEHITDVDYGWIVTTDNDNKRTIISADHTSYLVIRKSKHPRRLKEVRE